MQLEIQKGNKKKKSWSGDINVKVTPNEPTACSDCTKIFISERMMKIHWNRIHYDSNKPEADQPKSTKIVVSIKSHVCLNLIFSITSIGC